MDEGPKLRRSIQNASAQVSIQPSVNSSNPVSSILTAKRDLAANGKPDVDNDNPSICGPPSRSKYCPELVQLRSPRIERTQILSSFVSALFPLGVTSVQRSFFGSWLWHVPPRLNCSVVLDYAALSLALAYFGRVSGDQRVLQNAELSYTLGLRSLAVIIANTSKGFDAEVLCATLLLGHYEVRTLPLRSCSNFNSHSRVSRPFQA